MFYSTFQVSDAETGGHLIYELGNGQWDIPALRTALLSILPETGSVTDFRVEHDFPHIGQKGVSDKCPKLVQECELYMR